MLNDAIAAEAYKFCRNRSALFWGFVFVPLVVLIFNLMLESYLAAHNSGLGAAIRISTGLAGKIDLGPQILHAIGLAGSSFAQIFFAAGAAAIFAGEYRWETWRLLTPRNSRGNLLAAKFVVYAIACAISLAGLGFAALIYALYEAALNGLVPVLPSPEFAGQFLGVFLAGLAELLTLGAVVALVAVVTRAMIGALLTGVLFSFAQSIGMGIVHPWEAPLRYFAIFPDMSAFLLRAWVSGQEIAPGVFADPARILPAICFLAAWVAIAGGAAAALFHYQDLPRE